MDVLEFIKRSCPVGNGDLIILYAFKKGWKVTAPETAKRLGLRPEHVRRILNTMKSAGFCRSYKVEEKRAKIYEFNGKRKYLIKGIFEKKIMPYVNITPEEFLKIEEVEVALKFS